MDAISERRRYRRMRVSLTGRYMLTNGREYRCRARDMSPGGVALIVPVSGRMGERVIAYLDHIGRLEGPIVRTFPNGFALMILTPEHRRTRIATKLTRVADQQSLPEVLS
jgi:PilZ domain-containing protein